MNLKKEDLTVVVQGPLHENSIRSISAYRKHAGHIIFSFWSESATEENLKKIPDDVMLLCLDRLDWMPSEKSWSRDFENTWTTYCGIEEVETEYALKIKSNILSDTLEGLADRFFQLEYLSDIDFSEADFWLGESNVMRRKMDSVVNRYISKSIKS